jgi:hypothetical protein
MLLRTRDVQMIFIFSKNPKPTWKWTGHSGAEEKYSSTAGLHLQLRHGELLMGPSNKALTAKQTPPRVWLSLLALLPLDANRIVLDVHAGRILRFESRLLRSTFFLFSQDV